MKATLFLSRKGDEKGKTFLGNLTHQITDEKKLWQESQKFCLKQFDIWKQSPSEERPIPATTKICPQSEAEAESRWSYISYLNLQSWEA